MINPEALRQLMVCTCRSRGAEHIGTDSTRFALTPQEGWKKMERRMSERVLVCGGRKFDDYEYVKKTLDSVRAEVGIDLIIHGGATGADSLAGRWAKENNVECSVYHADWKTHGRKAGPMRNELMLTEGKPDRVIAFNGGRGTSDMLRRARGRVRVVSQRQQLAMSWELDWPA